MKGLEVCYVPPFHMFYRFIHFVEHEPSVVCNVVASYAEN